MNKFKNKVALVTGGAQGIGKAIAQAFSHRDVQVVIADIDREAGAETRQWLEEKGGKAVFIYTDVRQSSSVQVTVEETMARYGRLDFLINNAGVSKFFSLEDNDEDAFDEVINTNLRSAYLFARYAAPHLKEQKGAIINIASTRALMSEAHSEAYAASKGGLVALTHALAVSLGPEVRVNAISPGWIEVRPWQKEKNCEQVTHGLMDEAQHPVGRVGKPEDVGQAAVFLCSGEAGFITGQNLVVDGGMTIKMIYE